MSRDNWDRRRNNRRFPRVSGDEPLTTATRQLTQLFSPRERG